MKDIDNVGYDPTNKKLTYFNAINRQNEEQEFKFTGNKYVLLDFSAPGCRPCLQGIDKLAKVNSDLAEQIDIVMLWTGLNYDDWLNYEKKYQEKITWKNLLDANGAIFTVFDIDAYPTYILFDKNGRMIKKWKGGFSKKIEKYL